MKKPFLSITRIAAALQIDRAVFFSLLTRAWQLLAGPVTLIVISTRFTLEYQGYYNTFISIAGYTRFAMLGLAPVIVQFASHEWAKLSFTQDGTITGDDDAYARLGSLARMIRTWFVSAAIIAFIVLSISGYYFFKNSANAAPIHVWLPPWITMIFLCCINFIAIPYYFLLQGCGEVKSVFTYRFFQGMIAHITIWTAAFAGAKLWTYCFLYAANIACAIVFLCFIHRKLLVAIYRKAVSQAKIKWMEVLPMQWRVVAISLSSYFMFQLFTQTSMYFSGPDRAAQMGNTWNSILLLGAVMSAFLAPKMPQMGMYVAKKQYDLLDRLFFRTYAVSTTILITCGIVFWAVIYSIHNFNLPYFNYFSERFLQPLPTALFTIAYIIFVMYNGLGQYLIAHKKLPYFWVIVLATVLTSVSIWYVGPRYGAIGAATALIGAQLIAAPLMVIVWYRTRKKLHQDVAKQQ